jgi:hypothetical protein
MDVLDLFFKKYSYKFPKGYPDMNNEQDVLLLESILNKLGVDLDEAKQPFEKLSPKAQEVALNISDKLQIPKENILKQLQLHLNTIFQLVDLSHLGT